MKKKRWLLLVAFFFSAAALVAPSIGAEAPPLMVGRVQHIEGDLLRYVTAENDWVAVVRDAPFATGDTLFSGTQGMTELIVPNGTWIRTGYNTQIQFIALDGEVSETDVASGVARFYNKGVQTVVKATCPFGYVLSYPGSVFDFYVGENSVEVIAVRGKVDFVHSSTQAKYDVVAGSPSLLADQSQVAAGEGVMDPVWNNWNGTRERYWAAKAGIKGWSARYLPPSLRDEAYVLEENGRWESVIYEGRTRAFWRPVTVDAAWAPFTVGRWTDWYGDQTWIPAEPFGYLTHHYGNWIRVRNVWYWAPPVVRVTAGAPLLDVGFAWTPGRVAWIHSGPYVGWVPLAPWEPYYSHRHWGGRHDIVMAAHRPVDLHVRNYSYAAQAIVVNQNNFYNVTSYRGVRVTNISHAAIINQYRAAPVLSNSVISNYTSNRQRFAFTNVAVHDKPHSSVITRIHHNDRAIPLSRNVSALTLQQQIRRIPEGRINRNARIGQPRSPDYIVPAHQVNRPRTEVTLHPKDVKPAGRSVGGQPGQYGRPGQRTQQGIMQPARPGQVAQPGQPVRPGIGEPARQGHPGQHGTPGQPARPAVTQPMRPGQQGQPSQARQPGHISPSSVTGQPAKPQPQMQQRPQQARPQPQVQPQQQGPHSQVQQPRPQPTQPRPQQQHVRPQPQVQQSRPQVQPQQRPQVQPQQQRPQVQPQQPRPQQQHVRPQPQVQPQQQQQRPHAQQPQQQHGQPPVKPGQPGSR